MTKIATFFFLPGYTAPTCNKWEMIDRDAWLPEDGNMDGCVLLFFLLSLRVLERRGFFLGAAYQIADFIS